MSTFLISDTHFGDEDIIKYENRPFGSVDDMNEKLIYNWNQTVHGNDVVYVLGDFCSPMEDAKKILEQLRGIKILILGNHDNIYSLREWRDLGFFNVIDTPILYKNFYLLSHEPLYVNENMPYANIFGHVHSNPTYQDISTRSACVCVERKFMHYAPIEFSAVANMIKDESFKHKEKEKQWEPKRLSFN